MSIQYDSAWDSAWGSAWGKHFPAWLKLLIVFTVLLGIIFRFANLDQKIYWRDETATSSRISGYTRAEVFQQVYDGRLVDVEAFKKYQQPNADKGLLDTVNSLAIEDPQHPPLYYVLARLWVEQFGSSIATIRALSALISLFAFPCLYWLCLELFGSAVVGWVAMAILAISLVHVSYAQEARQFSLWTVQILLSSAALLRAIRIMTVSGWGIYAATVSMGLYTIPLSALVAISHGLYVVLVERLRPNKTVFNYLLASTIGLFTFLPWLLILINQRSVFQTTTSWTAVDISKYVLVHTWLNNISLILVSVPAKSLIFALPIVILFAYSLSVLCRNTPQRSWLFILTLSGIMATALVLPDIVLGGKRSLIVRYVFPCYLGIQLSLAYLFARQMTSPLLKLWHRKLWQLLFVIFIAIGAWASWGNAQTEIAWYKSDNELLSIARVINQATHPLVISDVQIEAGRPADGMIGSVLALSHLLDSQVQFQLLPEFSFPTLPDNFDHIFLFSRSNTLAEHFSQTLQWKSTLLYKKRASLWQLEKS